MKRNKILWYLCSVLLVSCSMTKNIPEDDQLFTGLTKISYENYDKNDNFITTQEEVEAALATAPNGAIFGSSYYRMPFSFGLSVWNHYSGRDSGYARWMTKVFGKQPVLMSWVNPELRASVARSVLRNHGYFHGKVEHDVITQKNPKMAKIGYRVNLGHLFTLDSIEYLDFPVAADTLIRATESEALLHTGDPFVVSHLDAERSRISNLLRNNGFYYYQPGYASYLADTFAVEGKAQLRFQLAEDVPVAARHPWYIGRININMRKSFQEQYTDSTARRYFTVRYHGKRPPLRPRVIMADLKIRPRQTYSYEKYVESVSKMNALGLFSMVDFAFTPRDTTASCDTLDLTINCTFEKPWDTYIETNFNSRTIGRMGPELRLGVTRRNAFLGGEKIDVNVHGSYEWSTSSGSSMDYYEYGIDGSIEFPRIIAPFFGGNRVRRDNKGRRLRRPRFFSTPITLAKASTDIIYRPKYYKMHVVSGEWTYRWQSSAQSHHEFSPLTMKYQFMNSHTAAFDSIQRENPYLTVSMQDYFIPQMRYTYTYVSPSGMLHPIRWETTLVEAGNLTSVGMMITGKKWNEKDKTLFKNPYSQFVKVETDFSKTWTLDAHAKLVGHVNAGVVYSYGNSDWVPNSELFYVGGANSLRAFPVRGIGPGSFPGFSNKAMSYIFQNGDLKFVCNLEYRRQLFGSLQGAVFLDAGNVWNIHERTDAEGNTLASKFQFKNALKEMAVGTGVGIRYDLDFLVLRLDWGIGLHVPYATNKSGYFNADGFKKNQTLHFAIGYPF